MALGSKPPPEVVAALASASAAAVSSPQPPSAPHVIDVDTLTDAVSTISINTGPAGVVVSQDGRAAASGQLSLACTRTYDSLKCYGESLCVQACSNPL